MVMDCRETLFRPLGEKVVSHGGKEKLCVHEEDGCSGILRDLAAVARRKSTGKNKDYAESAVFFCFKPATYAVVDEEIVEGMSVCEEEMSM